MQYQEMSVMPTSSIKAQFCILLLMTFGAALANGAAAPENPAPDPVPRVWLQLSGYQPRVNSEFQLDRKGGMLNGTEIDGERDLGLAREMSVPDLLLGVRLSESWRAEFEYMALNRSRRTTVANIGGIRFGGGRFTADIDARMRIHSYRLTAGYAFFQDPQRGEAGLRLGAQEIDFMAGLQGAAIVRQRIVSSFSEEHDAKLVGPSLGLFGSYRLGSNWVLGGRLDFVKIHGRGYDGRVLQLHADAMYRITPHISAGLGWRHDDMRIRKSQANLTRTLQYSFDGPQVFLRAAY